jgi:hypothetical protein
MNGLYILQLIQRSDVLKAQRHLVFRQLKGNLWVDYTKQNSLHQIRSSAMLIGHAYVALLGTTLQLSELVQLCNASYNVFFGLETRRLLAVLGKSPKSGSGLEMASS